MIGHVSLPTAQQAHPSPRGTALRQRAGVSVGILHETHLRKFSIDENEILYRYYKLVLNRRYFFRRRGQPWNKRPKNYAPMIFSFSWSITAVASMLFRPPMAGESWRLFAIGALTSGRTATARVPVRAAMSTWISLGSSASIPRPLRKKIDWTKPLGSNRRPGSAVKS